MSVKGGWGGGPCPRRNVKFFFREGGLEFSENFAFNCLHKLKHLIFAHIMFVNAKEITIHIVISLVNA